MEQNSVIQINNNDLGLFILNNNSCLTLTYSIPDLLEVCEPQMIENSKGYCGDNSVESESRPKLFSKSVSKVKSSQA